MNEITVVAEQTALTDAILREFADDNEIATDSISREELLQMYQSACDVLASRSQW